MWSGSSAVTSNAALWLHVAAVLGFMSLAGSALAWIYPEHRDIAVLAVIVPSFTRF